MTFTDFVAKYGIEVTILAALSIFMVGLLKVTLSKALEKIDKPNRKPLYELLSIVFAFGLTALWLVVKAPVFGMEAVPFTFEAVATLGSSVYVVVKVMYPLYENLRLRDLLQLIGNGILDAMKKKSQAKQVTKESEQAPTVLWKEEE